MSFPTKYAGFPPTKGEIGLITLHGITWNHTRGFLPLVATAQRYCELHPDVDIMWERRSLQQFADVPLDQLTDRFDLLVIDHPWMGYVHRRQLLLALNQHLDEGYLVEQEQFSVGLSYASYNYAGKQYALAIDAATPVASARLDLFQREGVTPPATWDDLLQLARHRQVIVPGIPIDSLMNLYMLCSTLGEDPFMRDDEVVSAEIFVQAIEMLRELLSLCPSEVFLCNPIAVYEWLVREDDVLYCPFAYGYVNYTRPDFSRRVLTFSDMVELPHHGRLVTTLGGTGIGISARSHNQSAALDFAQFVAGGNCQRGMYVAHGGQPGHRTVWTDPVVNEHCGDFFTATLPALERAWLRPRYDGYLHFQDRAGFAVQHYLQFGGQPHVVHADLSRLYRASRSGVLL